MNTPNKLTLLRIFLVPVFMAFLSADDMVCQFAALVVFAAASLTDMLDGMIARRQNLITTFGKFMDPLADKVLTTSAFVIFLTRGIIGPWTLMVILTREFMVSGVRLVAAGEGRIIAAAFWGKFKTVAQMAAIMATIVLLSGINIVPAETGMLISRILIFVSVVFTIVSGVEYILKNRDLIKTK